MCKFQLSLAGIFLIAVTACSKTALEKKPLSNVLVPTTLADFQGLLDNTDIFGAGTSLNYWGADEFYIAPAHLTDFSSSEQHVYSWQKEVFGADEPVPDWNHSYEQVFYCNVVMEGLKQIPETQSNEKWLRALRGDALFKRSLSFYHLLQVFAPAYDSATAATDLGIPLRLTTDSKERISRPFMRTCYQQLLTDLDSAARQLPGKPDAYHRNRACQAAAWGLLARIQLTLGQWSEAVQSGERCRQLYDTVLDYNNADTALRIPFKASNPEIIYPCTIPRGNLQNGLAGVGINIDTNLVRLYTAGDLRPFLFLLNRGDGTFNLKGYAGTFTPVMGITTPEVCLTIAEGYARLGNTAMALQYLNNLLLLRYKKGSFVPRTAPDASAALALVLAERRKELLFRGLRWADCKRLNRLGMGIVLHRMVGGQITDLPANDIRYALPIPETVVQENGLQQNPR